MYHVYMLRCADDSLYIGHARDPTERVEEHNSGRGAAYTFKRRPVELAYVEPHETRLTAIRRERQIKRWTRKKKEALIRGDVASLRSLSKRRT